MGRENGIKREGHIEKQKYGERNIYIDIYIYIYIYRERDRDNERAGERKTVRQIKRERERWGGKKVLNR